MANIILIETTADICSVALTSKSTVIQSYRTEQALQHAAVLPVYVQQILDYAKANNITIDAVAISSGPGSYTGLRIGCSLAKGLCYANNIPLIAVDTLSLIAHKAKKDILPDSLIAPMIDARRMEVYTSLFSYSLENILPPQPMILECSSFAQYLEQNNIYFVGSGAAKFSEIITHPHAHFINDLVLYADDMATLAEQEYENSQFVDVAYYEPFYLKDFYFVTK